MSGWRRESDQVWVPDTRSSQNAQQNDSVDQHTPRSPSKRGQEANEAAHRTVTFEAVASPGLQQKAKDTPLPDQSKNEGRPPFYPLHTYFLTATWNFRNGLDRTTCNWIHESLLCGSFWCWVNFCRSVLICPSRSYAVYSWGSFLSETVRSQNVCLNSPETDKGALKHWTIFKLQYEEALDPYCSKL